MKRIGLLKVDVLLGFIGCNLQTQRWAYQNNTFFFATRLGWLATELTSHFQKLYKISPFAPKLNF